MKRTRLNYEEGDCFALPLRGGGYARGVVARLNRRGIVFGYFFGPRFSEAPDETRLADLSPEHAVLARQFGDLGFLKGEWKVIGKVGKWNREEWPLPSFLHIDDLDSVACIRKYDENTLAFNSETKVPLSSVSNEEFPKDGLCGYGAIEIILTKLLAADREERGT